MQVPVGIYGEAICYYRNKGEVENIAMFICVYMVGENNAYFQFPHFVGCLSIYMQILWLSLSSASRRGFIKKHCGILGFFMMEEGNSESGYVFLGPHTEYAMLM